jgi:glucokinase
MGRILGVDIGGTNTKIGILKDSGEVEVSDQIPTRAAEGPGALGTRIREWVDGRSTDYPGITSAGFGCAGLLDGAGGYLYVSPNLPGWRDLALADLFESTLSLPVVIENDVNCHAYGEYRMGAGRGTNNFICIALGTGVGGGVIIDGKLYRGSSGVAGEVGHTVVMAGGPPCSCGGQGCLEALIGAAAIVDRAVSALARDGDSALRGIDPLTVKDISHAAARGDAVALDVLAETGRFLGIEFSNLVHIFDPEMIAVAGGVAGAGEFIMGPARETFGEHATHPVQERVRIVLAELGNKASFIGAALLAMERHAP